MGRKYYLLGTSNMLVSLSSAPKAWMSAPNISHTNMLDYISSGLSRRIPRDDGSGQCAHLQQGITNPDLQGGPTMIPYVCPSLLIHRQGVARYIIAIQ